MGANAILTTKFCKKGQVLEALPNRFYTLLVRLQAVLTPEYVVRSIFAPIQQILPYSPLERLVQIETHSSSLFGR